MQLRGPRPLLRSSYANFFVTCNILGCLLPSARAYLLVIFFLQTWNLHLWWTSLRSLSFLSLHRVPNCPIQSTIESIPLKKTCLWSLVTNSIWIGYNKSPSAHQVCVQLPHELCHFWENLLLSFLLILTRPFFGLGPAKHGQQHVVKVAGCSNEQIKFTNANSVNLCRDPYRFQ